EPNNTLSQASPLGVVDTSGPNRVGSLNGVSIDDDSDIDSYSFQVNTPLELVFSVSQAADSYSQGPQTQLCNTGTFTDYTAVHDLSLEVRNTSLQLIASSNSSAAGQTETVSAALVTPGTYYVLVRGGAANDIQLYNASWVGNEVSLVFSPLSGFPDTIAPGESVNVSVDIAQGSDTLTGTPVLSYRMANSGPFETQTMNNVSGNTWTGTIPPGVCGDNAEFFVTANGQISGPVTEPEGGPSAPVRVPIAIETVVFSDNFATDQGWSVGGDVSGTNNGQWEIGSPDGTSDRGDPNTDFDGNSTAYLTGAASGNTDVDGGETILISPAFAINGENNAVISFAFWYDNQAGDSPNADVFLIELSNDDGETWTLVETVGPTGTETAGGWNERSVRIADFVTPTDEVRIRFRAQDFGNGSVIEAGVDAVELTISGCPCVSDLNQDGSTDFFDLLTGLDLIGEDRGAGDFSGNGTVGGLDVIALLDLVQNGCP
ncbi:MAG: hypothetical protein AAGB34_03165, partial [Planctomycetota bacterium]